jgi:lipid-A-disaccharide synthase
MRKLGVEPAVRSESLSVVGLVEVLQHIPRIYGEFRKLVRLGRERKPHVALLTDSPDFHLRLAPKLHRAGIPVIYLIAPQVWAWRRGRVRILKETVRRLLCIFPFEEQFFREHGVAATYIGHPLARMVRPSMTKSEFLERNGIPEGRPLVAVLPGSRAGEVKRHIPAVADAVARIREARPDCTFVAGAPPGFSSLIQVSSFWERFRCESIQVVEGFTWDLLAHADVALAASGTVTIEAALLGTPMATFYRVSPLSWMLGRWLVRVPFLSMANLVAGRKVVPELIQDDLTGDRLAQEALGLLNDPDASARMRSELRKVREILESSEDPMDRAAREIETVLDKELVNAG